MITHPESSRQKRQRLIKEAIEANPKPEPMEDKASEPKKKKRFGK